MLKLLFSLCFVAETVYAQQNILHINFPTLDFLRSDGVLHNVLLRHWLAAILCVCTALCNLSGECLQLVHLDVCTAVALFDLE